MIVCMDTAGVDCRDGGQRAPQAVMCLGGMVGPQMLVGRRPVIMFRGCNSLTLLCYRWLLIGISWYLPGPCVGTTLTFAALGKPWVARRRTLVPLPYFSVVQVHILVENLHLIDPLTVCDFGFSRRLLSNELTPEGLPIGLFSGVPLLQEL